MHWPRLQQVDDMLITTLNATYRLAVMNSIVYTTMFVYTTTPTVIVYDTDIQHT
jgi:hypothetical protein